MSITRPSLERECIGGPDRRVHSCFGSAPSVVGRPSSWILKKTDRPDLALSAEIEPVPGARGYADQIAGFNFQCHHRTVLRSDMKQAAAGNDEAHLVLIVPVFYLELGQHRVQLGRLGVDIDNVSGGVTALGFESIDLRRVGFEYLLRGGTRPEVAVRIPSFAIDPEV